MSPNHPLALPSFALPPALAIIACAVPAGGDVLNGIDSLRARGFEPLAGAKVGLITNASGVARDGTPTIDLLHRAPDVHLAALFGPEHGLRGDLETSKIADGRDASTGLPVFSLYNGPERAPDPADLEGLDTLVFDIQDVGVRFYTYISTMGIAMEAAAAQRLRFVVLDRVNPIGGTAVDGPLRDGPRKFVAHHEIPIVHGMTVGEIAHLYRAEIPALATLDLEVVPVTGWDRRMRFDATGLPWVNPSPNMRSLDEALLYPGVGLVEFTNVSVGRGTATPFEHAGAPYIDGAALAEMLGRLPLEGVRAEPTTFTPDASKFAGQPCHGVRFTVTDPDTFRPLDLGLGLAWALYQLYPDTFEVDKVSTLLLHPETMAQVKGEKPPTDLRATLWADDLAAFARRRQPHLLYP